MFICACRDTMNHQDLKLLNKFKDLNSVLKVLTHEIRTSKLILDFFCLYFYVDHLIIFLGMKMSIMIRNVCI